MKIDRPITKTTKFLIANYYGIEIHLFIPKAESYDQKYYLQYKTSAQKKYYGNGNVKRIAQDYFRNLYSEISHSQVEADLAELYKQDLEVITYEFDT